MVVEDISWIRVDHHVISDMTEWLDRHNDFLVTNNTYVTDLEIEKQKLARSSFTITNRSPYGYYEVPLTVLLMRADTVVGVNQVTIKPLLADKKLEISV